MSIVPFLSLVVNLLLVVILGLAVAPRNAPAPAPTPAAPATRAILWHSSGGLKILEVAR